jgi:hypothetical protein
VRWSDGIEAERNRISSEPLPPLHHIASQKGINPVNCSARDLQDFLRAVTCDNATDMPRRFYSIRELAGYFCRRPSAIARLLDTLRSEGMLITKWGAGSFIRARTLNRGVRFRGVIAELVPLASHYRQLQCRELAGTISKALFRRGFVCRQWLYQNADLDSGEFYAELISAKPDSIIWLMPTPRLTLLGQRLLNCGIPVVRGCVAAEILSQLF